MATIAPRRRLLPHRITLSALVVGLLVTAVITTGARVSYLHTEQRLINLQTKLTALALDVAPEDLERRLGLAAGLAAGSTDPVAAFRKAIQPSLAPAGPFVTATLVVLRHGSVDVLTHLGAEPVRSPTGKAATALYESASKTTSLITSRAVGHGLQRLGYLMSATGPGGTYVASAGEPLPTNTRISVPANSPDAGLNVAIYYGPATTRSALIESNVSALPLGGPTSEATVPFGQTVLTLVASPEGPLAGGWSENLSWGVLVIGLFFSFGIAAMTERLMRRRDAALHLALENRRLFQEQRNVAVTLQHSLLPRNLPARPDVGVAVRYLPGTAGIDIGGDWYDAIEIGADQLFFTVGDVSGRGLAAASLMSTLRNAIRAFAFDGADPATVLSKVSPLLDVARGIFATALCGLLDLRSGELVLANAGHPEPLLLNGEGAEFVTTQTGAPIGVSREPYTPVRLTLAKGSTLIAYTDGLIERRGEALDVGLERLRASVTPSLGLEELLDALLVRIVPNGAPDDVAVLGIRRY